MSNVSHFLIERVTSLPISETQARFQFGAYDQVSGLWFDDATGIALVEQPTRDRPRSKKNDVETGEDQKGY